MTEIVPPPKLSGWIRPCCEPPWSRGWFARNELHDFVETVKMCDSDEHWGSFQSRFLYFWRKVSEMKHRVRGQLQFASTLLLNSTLPIACDQFRNPVANCSASVSISFRAGQHHEQNRKSVCSQTWTTRVFLAFLN